MIAAPDTTTRNAKIPYRHANPVADRFLVPARGMAFDCKDTTAKGLVMTISNEEGNRRTKNEYEEFTRHLNHDSSVHAALSPSAVRKTPQRATR